MEVVYAHRSTVTPRAPGILMAGNEASQFPCLAKLNRYDTNLRKKNPFQQKIKVQTEAMENHTHIKRYSPLCHMLSKIFDISNSFAPIKEAK